MKVPHLTRLAPCALVTMLALSGLSAAPARDDGWVPIFNGKDLDGWTPKIKGHALGDDPYQTFRVDNGVIKVSYDKYDKFNERFGHLFFKNKYANYRLRVEYRFVGDQCPGGPGWAVRNSGAMIHCQPPETMGNDQSFPVSIEVQFLGGNGKDERPTGNLCTPGTHVVIDGQLVTRHCTNSKSRTFHGDQWVTAEVEVHGHGKIKHFINGELVIEYERAQLDDKDADAKALIRDGQVKVGEGHISLQAESHPIEFRKVEIQVLDN